MSNTPTHGSDVQETPDWWKASDGRFYPPELHPNYVKPAAPAPPAVAPAVASAAPASAAEASTEAAAESQSLAERLRAEADRVGDEASAAADAGVGSITPGDVTPGTVAPGIVERATIEAPKIEPGVIGNARETLDGAAGGLGAAGAAAGGAVAGAAASALPGGMPSMPDTPSIPEVPSIHDVASAAPEIPSLPEMPSMSSAPEISSLPEMPSMPEALDPRATIPAEPPSAVAGVKETIIQAQPPMPQPSVPDTPAMPGTPAMPSTPPMPDMPSMPQAASAPAMPATPQMPDMPSMPPAPGAPAMPSMPPAPGAPAMPSMPPAPNPGAPAELPDSHEGPGGITYTAPPAESNISADELNAIGGMSTSAPPGYEQTSPVISSTAKPKSGTAGLVALIGGAAAIAGSLLQWGKGNVVGDSGLEKAIIEVAGFDSNGMFTAIAGAVLVLCGILFFTGVPKQLTWSIGAFLAGGVIVGLVVFSLIDIDDLSNRYATEWQAAGRSSVGDIISTQPDLGLWITGAGGILGVLAAPFVNRS